MAKEKTRRKGKSSSKGRITSKEMKQAKLAHKATGNLKDDTPIEAVKGIGLERAKKLRSKGIYTVGDHKRHIDKQIATVEAKEREQRQGFYNEMKQDEFTDRINSRYRKIVAEKNPHEKKRLLVKLKKDSGVKVIEKKTNLVILSKHVERRINSDIAKTDREIASPKIKYKWVVINQDGTPYYHGDDKDKAVRVFRNAKKNRKDKRIELHRYSTDKQLREYQDKITRKSVRKSDKDTKSILDNYRSNVHGYIDLHGDKWINLVKLHSKIENMPKSKITKIKMKQILEQDADIPAYELDDIKGKENWHKFTLDKIKEAFVFEEKQRNIALSFKNMKTGEQKYNNTLRMLNDALTSAKKLKQQEAMDLTSMKDSFVRANSAIKTATTEKQVSEIASLWKSDNTEFIRRIEDSRERQYAIGRGMKEYTENWYGVDVQESFETLIMPVLNNVAISNQKLFTYQDVDPKKVEFQASVRVQTLRREAEAKRIKEVTKEVKEGKTSNILAFRGANQQWVKLPHGQVVRLLNDRFAFKQSTKGFDKAIMEAEVKQLYDKGKLSPEDAYIMAFILSKDTGYDNLEQWKKDSKDSSTSIKNGIMDSSRFSGMFPTDFAHSNMKNGDYASYDLRSSTFGQMIHRNTKSDNQQTTGTVQEKTMGTGNDVSLTYQYNDGQNREANFDRKTLDKFFSIFRKTRKSDTYPFKAIHFASARPVIIDFAKANLSIMVAPMSPEEDEDYYEDDDEDLLDDLD